MKMRIQYQGKTYRVPFKIWRRHIVHHVGKALKHALLWPFEWFGIALALLVLPNLPRRPMFALCDLLAAAMYCLDRGGRKLALKNLQTVLPASGILGTPGSAQWRRQTAKIVRRSYRNMAHSVGYAFWTFRAAERRCRETGVISPVVKEFFANNRNAVTISGHFGCWEITSQLAYLEGHRIMSVAKAIGSSGMTKMLMRARQSIGQEIIPAEGAFKRLLGGLREGKTIGLLVDQIVPPVEGGIAVKFFNRDYYVSPAPAFFAAKTKLPIFIGWCRSLPNYRYRLEMLTVIPAEESRDIRNTTQRISDEFEKVIRRHPSSWVLNYDYFQKVPTAEEAKALAAMEQKMLSAWEVV